MLREQELKAAQSQKERYENEASELRTKLEAVERLLKSQVEKQEVEKEARSYVNSLLDRVTYDHCTDQQKLMRAREK